MSNIEFLSINEKDKEQNWLARNQNSVSEWDDKVFFRGLLFQWNNTIKKTTTKRVGTSSSSHWKLNCSRSWKIAELLLSNYYSLISNMMLKTYSVSNINIYIYKFTVQVVIFEGVYFACF